jgi:hypothetical protein
MDNLLTKNTSILELKKWSQFYLIRLIKNFRDLKEQGFLNMQRK